jgi:predicted AAA+ superfamily ATPase
MALKPWYELIKPRKDLRQGNVPEASEFAVHLDQVRDGRAIDEYKNPAMFFTRTYLTKNLTRFAAEAIRRLSGEKVETNAVFHMITQFGGGKTHALTLSDSHG